MKLVLFLAAEAVAAAEAAAVKAALEAVAAAAIVTDILILSKRPENVAVFASVLFGDGGRVHEHRHHQQG